MIDVVVVVVVVGEVVVVILAVHLVVFPSKFKFQTVCVLFSQESVMNPETRKLLQVRVFSFPHTKNPDTSKFHIL